MVQLPDAARQVAARAIRAETPCGTGTMAWHSWGNGPPVVLLHGGSGSWTHWVRNVMALEAAGRRVLVPDLPGFGDSALTPAGMDADALPGPVELGLQQLIGDAACDMVGFSFGSMVAAFMAQRFPRRVSRLVVIGAPGLGLWKGRKTLDLKPSRHLADAQERRAVHRENLGILMLHHEVALDDDAVTLQQHNVERDRTRGRSLARTDVLVKTLRELSCPVSVIYGRHDALYRDGLGEVRDVMASVPAVRQFLEIEDAGHWVQYERAEAFNAALLGVLAA